MIDGNATLWEEMDLLRDAVVEPFVRRFLVGRDAGAAAGKCLYVDARDLDAPTLPGTLVACSALAPRAAGAVRLLVMSDTHDCLSVLEPEKLPRADVLVHCGDLLMLGRLRTRASALRALADIDAWFARAPAGEVVVVGGNHDLPLEKLGAAAVQAALPHAKYLQHSWARVAGLRVFGSPLSRGTSDNRAFQPPAGGPVAAAAGLPDHADAECDVLVTHAPPVGGPLAPAEASGVRGREDGLPTPALLHCFGHLHEAHGVARAAGGGRALDVCGSIMAQGYWPTQPPVVIDVRAGPSSEP